MGQTLIGGLNNVGQRGMPSNAGLSQAALQRQAGAGVNIGGLGAAPGGLSSCMAVLTSRAAQCRGVIVNQSAPGAISVP